MLLILTEFLKNYMALRPPNIENYIQNNIWLQSKMKYDKIAIRYKGLKKEHDYESVCNKTWRKRNKP